MYLCVEINHSISFTTDPRLDREVKDRLLYDTLVLINLGACDRHKATEEEAQDQRLAAARPLQGDKCGDDLAKLQSQ